MSDALISSYQAPFDESPAAFGTRLQVAATDLAGDDRTRLVVRADDVGAVFDAPN
jgi:hypothetical protein